jgi:membrane-bound lytic murein transglycosylase A
MIRALRLFQNIVKRDAPWAEQADEIQKTFEFYQSVGNDGAGTILITGYYEPILEGDLRKTERFRYPLYSIPEETVTVPLGQFNSKYGQERLVGRLKGREVVPHYTRKEIDTDQVLSGRGLEIVWVDDPVALFILHIQGSGQIRLPDGKILRVNYAQKNGRPFRGLTSYMVKKGFLSETEKSYQHMKSYLNAHPEFRDEIMNHNESYIFFRIVEEGPIGSLGLPIVASRSIATDPAVFPKGALGFMISRKPVFDEEGQVKTWRPYSRFIFSHDAGGAIKGPGRVDLFCGTGEVAEVLAGSLKEKGRLYFLAPRRQ